MRLAAIGHAPLFEADRPKDARLVIGVRADVPRSAAKMGKLPVPKRKSPIEVTLDVEGHRIVLPVEDDSTDGMLRTGAIVLDISKVDVAPMIATLEFRAPAGFARAPRIIRIEPNAVPIIQRLAQEDTCPGDGKPDQGFDLQSPALEFEPGTDPVKVEVETLGKVESWTKVERTDDSGPADRHFTLDPVAARVAFGNGVNGAVPAAETKIYAKYSVCDGAAGNIAANRKWVVRGFAGRFGVNPDPTTGGEEPSGWVEQRREARQAVGDRHALISASDLEQAAVALPGLEVGRAWMVPPSGADIATGTMRLVAMRLRPGSGEPTDVTESKRWLDNVRRRLESRVPLGSRLRVIAPQYVPFSIEAQVEVEPRKDPADVRKKVVNELVRRTTLVSDKAGVRVRTFGLPLNKRDLVAWIQKLPEVRRVLSLSIQVPGHGDEEEVLLSPSGLPAFDQEASKVDVVRIDAVGGAA
jgi:predicted phage baseplate assembly protein